MSVVRAVKQLKPQFPCSILPPSDEGYEAARREAHISVKGGIVPWRDF
jgi:hypothetical protein